MSGNIDAANADSANPDSRKRRLSPCDAVSRSSDKQRREEGKRYIEDLAELLSANLTHIDRLSVKPDKCRIISKTVQQIQFIKRMEQAAQAEDEVQKSDISSSSQSLIEKDSLGPLLLEALDGFFFVLNGEGRIMFVSENVTNYLGHKQEELLNSSVYSILHLADHTEFLHQLLNKPLVNSVPWSKESNRQNSHTFNCRMLVRGMEQGAGQSQEARQKYEIMQCFTVSQPKSIKEERDDPQSCLICIARRVTKPQLAPVCETFITKQDTTGKIISIDASSLRATGRVGWEDLVRKCIYAFFQPQERGPSEAKQLLQEVLRNGTAVSAFYRFSLSDGTVLRAQTKCKLCYPAKVDAQPVIMGMYSMDRELNLTNSQPSLESVSSVRRSEICSASPARTSPPHSVISSISELGLSLTPGASNLPSFGFLSRMPVGSCSTSQGSARPQSPKHSRTRVTPLEPELISPRGLGSARNPFSPSVSCAPSPARHPYPNPSHNTYPCHFLHPNPNLPGCSLQALSEDKKGSASLTGTLSVHSSPVPQPLPIATEGAALECKLLFTGNAGESSLRFEHLGNSSASGWDNRTMDGKTCQDMNNAKLMELLTRSLQQSRQCELDTASSLALSPGTPPVIAQSDMLHSSSLSERHKILHRLLQQEGNPSEIPAFLLPNVRKEVAGCGQEGDSSRRKDGKDHHLLRYLLDRDEPSSPTLRLADVTLKWERTDPFPACTLGPGKPPQDRREPERGFTELDRILPTLEEAARLPSNCLPGVANSSRLPRGGKKEQFSDPLHSNSVSSTLQRLSGLPELDSGPGVQQFSVSRVEQPRVNSIRTEPSEEGTCFTFQMDQLLCPPTSTEGREDEKALIHQLLSFLSARDEVELVEIDKALGIDKLIQMPPNGQPAGADLGGDGLMGIGLPTARNSAQGPLNAQMVAQRQREYISQQHRQWQMMQQHARLMGLHVPPRLVCPPPPISYSPSYSTAGSPPSSASSFTPLASSTDPLPNPCNSPHTGNPTQTVPQARARLMPHIQQNISQYPTSALSQQRDLSAAPSLSPNSPTLPTLVQPAQSSLIRQAPAAPGYETAEGKVWQRDTLGNSSEYTPAGQEQPGSLGMYNNMSITVSMDSVPGSVRNLNHVSGQMHMGTMQLPSITSMCPERVQQVQVFADVQCTVNVVGGDNYLNQAGPMGSQKNQSSGQAAQNQQKSLLQQLLTE